MDWGALLQPVGWPRLLSSSFRSQDERAMLDRMREALGVPDDEAMRIERDAARGVA